MLTPSPRVLSLEATSRGFGFAVLEGSERLVDWGLITLRRRDHRSYISRVEKLFKRYSPEELILADGRSSRRGPRAKSRAKKVAKLAKERGIAVRYVSRAHVLRMFAALGKTNWTIAQGIARWFPELSPKLPKRRRTWEPQDPRMAIFTAIARALTVLREDEWDHALGQ